MSTSNKIIGTFTGKCADSTVYNSNSMKLGRQLWKNLFNSTEYQQAIKLRHYIGFLGHPEDPNCMDYRNACIILTKCWIESDGSISGTFDLIDTPVGRVVKAFIDAGVKFGISVRGAGDLDNDGVVDPDTFVFRGFDLVTFPAYSDAIPEFKKVAASTDIRIKAKYDKLVSTIRSNINDINDKSALEFITACLPANKEIGIIANRQICQNNDNTGIQEKLYCMARLYAAQNSKYNKLSKKSKKLKSEVNLYKSELQKAKLVATRTSSIMSSQFDKLSSYNSKLKHKSQQQSQIIASIKNERDAIQLKLDASNKERKNATSRISQLETSLKEIKAANNQLKSENLIYKRTREDDSAEYSKTIDDLNAKLSETVTASSNLNQAVSDRDAKIADLQAQLSTMSKLLKEYQLAYKELYAGISGVSSDISFSSSTSVKDMERLIQNHQSVLPSNDEYSSYLEQPQYLDGFDDDLITV